MDIPVGVRRPIVENENRLPPSALKNLVIQPHFIPFLLKLGLPRREIGFHRKSRFGEVYRFAVVQPIHLLFERGNRRVLPANFSGG